MLFTRKIHLEHSHPKRLQIKGESVVSDVYTDISTYLHLITNLISVHFIGLFKL